MKKFTFITTSILAITFIFVACSSENGAIEFEDCETIYEFIDFSMEMSPKVKEKKLHEAEKRILENIKIINGKISLSHISAEEIRIEEGYFEAMKYLLERVKNPYDIIMPKTRQIVVLPNGENVSEEYITNKAMLDYLISSYLDSEFEKKCFDQYWYAQGDITITDDDWSKIKIYAEQKHTPGTVVETISFYDNPDFDYALGSATVYFDGDKAVGLSDTYDFNPLPEGERSEEAETITRVVNNLGKIYGAKKYEITYGTIINQ